MPSHSVSMAFETPLVDTNGADTNGADTKGADKKKGKGSGTKKADAATCLEVVKRLGVPVPEHVTVESFNTELGKVRDEKEQQKKDDLKAQRAAQPKKPKPEKPEIQVVPDDQLTTDKFSEEEIKIEQKRRADDKADKAEKRKARNAEIKRKIHMADVHESENKRLRVILEEARIEYEIEATTSTDSE